VSRINVLVAATSRDMKAEGISEAIAQRSDMILIKSRVVLAEEVAIHLDAMPSSAHCALVLVGPLSDTKEAAARHLQRRKDLVVLRVDIIEDIVRISVRDVGLDSLLTALVELVDRAGTAPRERVSQFHFRPLPAGNHMPSECAPVTPEERPLLNAALDWVHAVLRSAVEKLTDCNGDLHGLTVTAATVVKSLDARPAHTAGEVNASVEAVDAALSRALAAADGTAEPLAVAASALGLDALEFRVMVLALGAELDPRYQRCAGLLLDDLGRRAGTLGLYTDLLGEPTQIRRQLMLAGNLARWRVFEVHQGDLPHADETLRLDAGLLGWLLGDRDALERDTRVRRTMRPVAWPGASLLDGAEDTDRALSLLGRLRGQGEPQCIVLANENPAAARALLELGAQALDLSLIRVDAERLSGLDAGEIEESGIRLARLARLNGQPLIVDTSASDDKREQDGWLRTFLIAASRAGYPAALIATDAARIARLLGSVPYEIENPTPLTGVGVAAVQAAASGAEASLTHEAAQVIANQYPLQIDNLEHAMRLARTRPLASGTLDPRAERFIAACKDVSAEGASRLADRIEPVFKLDDVVLPADRKGQLEEIVDNIRLAPRVLDGWKFRHQLPYGRGLTALFHGPSGTGKTMAALGVAHALGIQILRIDLSRVVSKYIGDTEKNIDRVFADAQACGAALLIDEADALFGKRSEVNDAHDRYANIEVAFLLQRMEAYEGLAILTTNLRQNLDPAFLRRLRFIVDFPRPNAEAREKIWRQCLPEDSHDLDDAAFRQLARKIDLTGGHLRQITLRAAFVAAAADSKIGIDHVAHACRAEFAKLGLPPVVLDIAERRKAA
jgi:AAA+ superfamily predicted ATPase